MDRLDQMTVTKDGVEVERDEWKIWGEKLLCVFELLTRRDRLRLLQRPLSPLSKSNVKYPPSPFENPTLLDATWVDDFYCDGGKCGYDNGGVE
ncbi:hypothetical protein D9758_016529 [Tetrapyrgos nigripes]|uniref:Uncharacterized protein n=1 Tax=Tetrapyrgos nigripes TaxID=182062 RepID=A0A8H5CC57_9AGAR|nr:hypothetical protein D9758_016529 [Tetrapyrgos nigripes]